MLTITVVTDEPLVEGGLRCLLADGQDFRLLGCFKNAGELSENLQVPPDVLLCALRGEQDVSFSDLRAASPRSAVVILRRDFSAEYAHQALQMGIRGLVSSTASLELLRDCLRKTAQGELWMENSLSMLLLDTRPIHLSKRQSELIHLLAQGLKNKEIASILGISEGTVKSYLTALFEKVGAKDRFELALFGLKHLKDFKGEHAASRGAAREARSFAPGRLQKINVA